MTFQKMLVWINCGLFVVFGIGFLLVPEALAEFVTGAAPSTASAVTDMRATYGGMALGLGLIFGLSARDSQTVNLGVWGVFLVMISLAGGRLLGIILDGAPNAFIYLLFVAEAVMAILGFWVLRSGGKG